MRFHVCNLPSMTIPNGGSTSNAVPDVGDAYALTIYTPTMTATMATVQVCPTSSGTVFFTLQSGGTDVVVYPNTATIIHPPDFKQIRVISSSAEGQDDVFKMTSHFVA